MNFRPALATFHDRAASRRPGPINTNTLFQATVVALVLAHAGALLCVWLLPTGVTLLPGLNVVIASGVLLYAASRARYILATVDWAYLSLITFETLILIAAIGALRGSRGALICSSVAFGLHALASIGAVVVAFGFRFTKLM